MVYIKNSYQVFLKSTACSFEWIYNNKVLNYCSSQHPNNSCLISMRSKCLHHKPCFYKGFYNPQKVKLSQINILSRVIIGLNLTYSCEIIGVTKSVVFTSFHIMHNNRSYIITRIQTQKRVPNPCTAFIDEEEYYHNSLVYSGGSTLYKVRFTKNTILVVSFMQICLSNNIMYIHNIIPAS